MCADEPHDVSVIRDHHSLQESMHNRHQLHALLLIPTTVMIMKSWVSELDKMLVAINNSNNNVFTSQHMYNCCCSYFSVFIQNYSWSWKGNGTYTQSCRLYAPVLATDFRGTQPQVTLVTDSTVGCHYFPPDHGYLPRFRVAGISLQIYCWMNRGMRVCVNTQQLA